MSEQAIRQESVTLPHFHYDVPVLYLADGGPYIPVIAICQMLGIRADTHIPRWRKLLLWITARKLPVYLPKRGKRLVWCLPLGEVPFLYSCFNWQCVPYERRAQLLRAAEEGSRISGLAYQARQQSYKAMRHLLFTTLTNFTDFEANLQRCAKNLAPSLEDEFRLWLNNHIQYGRSLIRETIACARQLLHEQGDLPIVDGLHINLDGNVIDTFSMPLLPIVPRKGSKQIFENIEKLTQWYQELIAFLEEQGLWPNGGQNIRHTPETS